MSKDQEVNEFFDIPIYYLNKKYLSVIGQWPYQSRKLRTMIVFTVWTAIISVVIPEVICIVEVIKDLKKVIDCLPALFLTYAAFVMIFNSISNFHMIKETFDTIKENWEVLKEEHEISIFQKHAEEAKFLIIFYSVCILIALGTFIIVPLFPKFLDIIMPLNESRPLSNLLEVEYFVDPHKYYVPIFLHGLQAALSVVFTICTMDAYFIMIVQHACGMFDVLGYRISNVSKQNSKSFVRLSYYEQDKIICGKVIECSKYHSVCIRFAELIEDQFTVSWFMQIFLNMLVVSITGVQTITRANEPELMLKFGLNTTSIIFRLFYISWPGQKIFDQSSRVHEFISNTVWYDLPPMSKKLLLVMLLRSSKPCNITAGKMVALNFETYCTLMQTSMSYFTMILSTQ